MKTGLIYIAINKINGKSYIGQTTKKLKERIRCHYKDAKNKKHTYAFINALRKYNEKDWEWIILQDKIPIKYLNKKEIDYIFSYNTYKKGYNSTPGGEHNPMQDPKSRKKLSISKTGIKRPDVAERNRRNKGKKLSKEHKKKISESSKGKNNHFYGKKHSNKTKAKGLGRKKGCVPWNKGKCHSEETKKKMREAWKKRKNKNK